jgi:hypothetical protein
LSNNKLIDRLLDTVDWVPVEYTKDPSVSSSDLPYMTHKGILKIGGIELPCAVLSNGERIFYGEFIDELLAELGKLGHIE